MVERVGFPAALILKGMYQPARKIIASMGKVKFKTVAEIGSRYRSCVPSILWIACTERLFSLKKPRGKSSKVTSRTYGSE